MYQVCVRPSPVWGTLTDSAKGYAEEHPGEKAAQAKLVRFEPEFASKWTCSLLNGLHACPFPVSPTWSQTWICQPARQCMPRREGHLERFLDFECDRLTFNASV